MEEGEGFVDTRKVTDFFDFKEPLGKGSYATVFRAVNKITGESVAIKQMIKKSMNDVNKVKAREIAVMKKIQHPNAVKLFDVFEDERNIYLILELIEGGELFEKIIDAGHFDETLASTIIRRCLEVVAYLHAHGIVHRDLKPENLLCKGDNPANVVVADFGFAKIFDVEDKDGQLVTQCGSLHYTAPEVLTSRSLRYGPKCDVWSMGVIGFVLLTGCFPFDSESTSQLYEYIRNGRFRWPAEIPISSAVKHLINHMILPDVDARYSAQQALEHPWVQGKDISTVKLSPSLANLLRK
eukprot:TRINITY_DN17257_c0_g1_i1.p1 TRINITY_DN17257_c0_g1~~TRINITY_DN17257_c0_g1_i1.p1  ORF type:complete len:311 (+),score=54.57 TRINITY_DN17257_c0_g1_i1:47-934(+)